MPKDTRPNLYETLGATLEAFAEAHPMTTPEVLRQCEMLLAEVLARKSVIEDADERAIVREVGESATRLQEMALGLASARTGYPLEQAMELAAINALDRLVADWDREEEEADAG